MPVTLTLDGAALGDGRCLGGPIACAGGARSIWARAAKAAGAVSPCRPMPTRATTPPILSMAPDTPLRAAVVERGAGSGARFATCRRLAHRRAGASCFGRRHSPPPTSTAARCSLWQAPLPEGAEAERLQSFAAEGGVVIFFPPGQADARQFNGMGWGDVQTSEAPEGFRILRWNEDEGPLAKSDEHLSLPLAQTDFRAPPGHRRPKERPGGLRGWRGLSGAAKCRQGRSLFLRVAPARRLVQPGRRPRAGADVATPAAGRRPPLASRFPPSPAAN